MIAFLPFMSPCKGFERDDFGQFQIRLPFHQSSISNTVIHNLTQKLDDVLVKIIKLLD